MNGMTQAARSSLPLPHKAALIQQLEQTLAMLKACPEEPKICATCDCFDEVGSWCDRFSAKPPEAFQCEPGACREWRNEIPF